ncbi:HepT-like ribonuclease domain-containing protein [Flavobacterium restrictum]|uniref:DUF86 domain-containing protein n=1 Tax=Flavobacterium restrictum TaxID=2594428 RepID=A0A553E005_9FLAO|nr:HepT-like ribonuclease domain-containing protein [Flavobacterium restrictum]TRX38356.1 DUF86 domain-containing protein [Flavobacterium restrictum]
MKTEKHKIYCCHILEAIDKLELVASTTTREEFLGDWLKQDAVLKNFIVIGEAISQIDEEIKQKFPNVDWRGAKSMRNFIVHEYFSVDNNFVWETIFETIPIFKIQINEILNSFE